MELSICTDIFAGMTLAAMLDTVQSYGIHSVELTTGGWGACRFIPSAAELAENPMALAAFREELNRRNMTISALNCSGNQLCPGAIGKAHTRTIRDTVRLAEKLGVKTLVLMSGLPAASPGDETPNWITSTVSWPEFQGRNYMKDALCYQWDAAASWWTEFTAFARDHGIERLAIEEFPCQLVHNVRTLNQLCDRVGGELSRLIGMNLDPSHLLVQGADPILAARALGDKLFYIHGKDARIERGLSAVDGLLENLPVENTSRRTWNYVAIGCGQNEQWWKEFLSVARMSGYDGPVSIEMEDLTMSVEAGLQISVRTLRDALGNETALQNAGFKIGIRGK